MSAAVLPSDVAFASGRIAVAHAGIYGPVGTLVESRSALGHAFSLHLSEGVVTAPVLPRLAWLGGELVGLHPSDSGVVLRSLPGGEPIVVAPEARALGLATAEGSLVTAIVDAAGLHLGLHRGVAPSASERVRVVERADLLDAAEVVYAGTSWHVFYAPRGEAALGVVRWDGVSFREVRHPLASPVRSLHAATTGRRTVVAIGLGTDEIALAVLDSEGNMIERPHVVVREPGSVLEHPRVVWTGRGFGVTAIDRQREALLLRPSGEGAGPDPLELPAARGPMSIAFYAGELIAVAVESDGEDVRLLLRSCDRSGGQAQTHRLGIAPPDTALRSRALVAAQRVEATRARVAGALYRDGTVRTARLDAAAGFRADTREGHVELRVRPRIDAGFHVEVRAGDATGGDEAEETPASLARLARWVRGTFSTEARAEAARDRVFAAYVLEGVEGASDAEVLRDGECVRLTFTVGTLPEGVALGRLVAEVARYRGAPLTPRLPSAKPSSRGGEPG